MIKDRKARQRGFVLITMAASSIAMLGILGLSVDVGRMFIAKNETQAYCDSAALAAALKLDGTTAGITAATAAVNASVNSWNMDSARIVNPTIEFAPTVNGAWNPNPSPAAGYTYVRVKATVQLPLYFIPTIVGFYTQSVGATAIGQQLSVTALPRGLAPYTAVSTTSGQNFGLTVGSQYDIQWPQFNGSRSGCSPANPDKCFNSPPCAGDSLASKAAVTQYWAASNDGYWGSNSNSIIRQEVLDAIQLQPLDVNQNIASILTSGNKAVQGALLDERVQEDGDTADNVVASYQTNSYHNGRRLIAIPIVDPTSASVTTVVGYGAFLLLSNGASSNYYTKLNGNDAFCAVYAGPYVIGSGSSGGGGGSGAFRVVLAQ